MAGDFDSLFAEFDEPATQAAAPEKNGEDVEALLSSFEAGPVDPPSALETDDVTAFLAEVGTAVEAAGPPQMTTTQEDVDALLKTEAQSPVIEGLLSELMRLADQAYLLSRAMVDLRNRLAAETVKDLIPVAPKRRGSAKTPK